MVLPVDEYDALEATAEVLADPDTPTAIRRGLDELRTGDQVPLEEVRAGLRREEA